VNVLAMREVGGVERAGLETGQKLVVVHASLLESAAVHEKSGR
jgi:hypothetical protein